MNMNFLQRISTQKVLKKIYVSIYEFKELQFLIILLSSIASIEHFIAMTFKISNIEWYSILDSLVRYILTGFCSSHAYSFLMNQTNEDKININIKNRIINILFFSIVGTILDYIHLLSNTANANTIILVVTVLYSYLFIFITMYIDEYNWNIPAIITNGINLIVDNIPILISLGFVTLVFYIPLFIIDILFSKNASIISTILISLFYGPCTILSQFSAPIIVILYIERKNNEQNLLTSR